MQSFYGDRKWRALSGCSGGVFELPRISSKNSKQRLAAFQYGVLDNISDGVSVWHLSSDKFRIIQNINRFPAFMKVLQNHSQNSFAFKSVWMAHTSSSGQYSRAKVPTSVFLKKNLQEREKANRRQWENRRQCLPDQKPRRVGIANLANVLHTSFRNKFPLISCTEWH